MKNNIEELKKFRFKTKVQMRWSDIDEMRHINNAVYLTYFEEARLQYFLEVCEIDWEKEGVILATATLNYHQPLKLSDDAWIYVRLSKMGTKSFEFEYMIVSHKENGAYQLITSGSSVQVMFDYKNNISVPVPDYIKKQLTDFES